MNNYINKNLNQAVILAGGKGTRLKPFTDTMPKPMFIVNDEPFIVKLIKQIKNFGIDNILLLLGYKSDIIINELGNGSKYGVNIQYSITPVEYDTADRLVVAKDLLDDRFLLMYCDNYCPININKLNDISLMNKSKVTLTVYKNKDKWTKDNILVDDNDKVIIYDKTHKNPNLSGVDIGYAIIDKSVIELIVDCNSKIDNKFPANTYGSFSNIYKKLVDSGDVFAYQTEHRYYSIGSYDRMKWTYEFFKEKKAVFLDRDGTINVRPPKACYIENIEDFIWLENAKQAIKILNDNNYLVILITNQPGIARKRLTNEILNDIHKKMQNDLKEINAHIDYIYVCPHDWDEGCECRKPKPGMIFDAQKDLSLDLSNCFLFGDDDRDIEAGESADVKSIKITNEYNLYKAVNDLIKNNKE